MNQTQGQPGQGYSAMITTDQYNNSSDYNNSMNNNDSWIDEFNTLSVTEDPEWRHDEVWDDECFFVGMIGEDQASESIMELEQPVPDLACYPPTVQYVKLTDKAFDPVRATSGQISFDLSLAYSYELPPRQRCFCNIDVAFKLSLGYFGQLEERSGLAKIYGLQVLAGIIDPAYEAAVCVVLYNSGSVSFSIQPGDQICQLVVKPYQPMEIEETTVESLSWHRSMTPTEVGFGSTGFNQHDLPGASAADMIEQDPTIIEGHEADLGLSPFTSLGTLTPS